MDRAFNKELTDKLKGALELIPSPAIITDCDGNFILENEPASILLSSVTNGELTRSLIELSHELSQDQPSYKTMLSVSSHEQRPIDLSVDVSRNSDLNYLFWVLQNITPATTKNEFVDCEKTDYAERMASIGEMSAAIVHEIRNPLTIIIGQVSLAQEYRNRGKLTEEFMDRLISRLNKSSQQINHIIRSLLNLSRNACNDPKKPQKISEIIDEVKLFASMKITGAKVPLKINDFDTQLTVPCYPSELIQVLVNLVKNAKEEVYKNPNPWVEISIEPSQSFLTISVTDSGHGIAPEVADKMFEPYFTTKARGEGTGLGLSLCKRLIENHHDGKFYLDKNSSHTRFSIELPLPQSQRRSA